MITDNQMSLTGSLIGSVLILVLMSLVPEFIETIKVWPQFSNFNFEATANGLALSIGMGLYFALNKKEKKEKRIIL